MNKMNNITIIKDYLGNELHEGDAVLYCNGCDKEFTEGVVINARYETAVDVINVFLFEKIRKKPDTRYYTSIYSECSCRSTARLCDELINLTAMGMRDKFDICT